MNNEAMDLSKWFSSYGLMTAERILERFQFKPDHQVISTAVKTPDAFFHLLLLAPVQNVMNGIIFEQAKDYQIYIQKLFIDYLMSGEDNKPADSPGASTRERLEESRQAFMEQGEAFEQLERRHLSQIAQSQKETIDFIKIWKPTMDSIINVIHKESDGKVKKQDIRAIFDKIFSDTSIESFSRVFVERTSQNLEIDASVLNSGAVEEKLVDFIGSFQDLQKIITQFSNEAIEIREQLKSYRRIFYDSILQISETMSYLSDYHPNQEQIQTNKAALDFDNDVI